MPSALQITINATCTPSPNGSGASGAKLSRSSGSGESNQVNWQAAKACTVTVPKGFFVGFENNDMVLNLTAGGTSSTQTLLSTAATGNLNYTITGCSASGPPDPPMIVIDA
jgi:hypothetical protein